MWQARALAEPRKPGLLSVLIRVVMQEEKDYVQHHLRRNAFAVSEAITTKGGYVYVCGDGAQMAKDVHAALLDVLMSGGNLALEQADAVLKDMALRKRYIRDIWS